VTASGDSTTQERDDEWLVVRCQLGERAAFDELVGRWHVPLWKCVRRLTGDDAATDDIVQDSWLRIVRGIGRLRDGSKWRAWMFSIARRVWMDRLRLQYAMPRGSDIDLGELPGESPLDARTDDLETMHEELIRLPVTEREVLTLFYLQELSLEEVSMVMDVPVGTVKSRLFRARRMLRYELTKVGIA
jgi:RNA polymerase sigma-70 factor (ECF subfamily)